MAKIFKAWQCIGCGRIDGPQNCIGVCEDRKAEFVHAFEYEDAIGRAERAEARVQTLESFLRRLALTTPRADAWQRSYTNLQAEARRLLSVDATALQSAAPDVSERPAADRG